MRLHQCHHVHQTPAEVNNTSAPTQRAHRSSCQEIYTDASYQLFHCRLGQTNFWIDQCMQKITQVIDRKINLTATYTPHKMHQERENLLMQQDVCVDYLRIYAHPPCTASVPSLSSFRTEKQVEMQNFQLMVRLIPDFQFLIPTCTIVEGPSDEIYIVYMIHQTFHQATLIETKHAQIFL